MIYIFTDLEPDDWLCIVALKILYAQDQVQFIVGEGNPVGKAARLASYLSSINWKCQIHLGDPSDKKYDYDNKFSGHRDFHAFNPDYIESGDTIIMIKPPRELLRWGVDKIASRKLTMFIYGSFNIRTLYQSSNVPLTELTSFLNAFKKVYYVSSFYVLGQTNSMNSINGTSVYNALDGTTEGALLDGQIKNWNEHIYQDVKDGTSKTDIKIKEAIEAHPEQMVFADPLVSIAVRCVQDGLYSFLKEFSIHLNKYGFEDFNSEVSPCFRATVLRQMDLEDACKAFADILI